MFAWTLGLKPQLVEDGMPNGIGDLFLSMISAAGYAVVEITPAPVSTEMVALIYPDAPDLAEPRKSRVFANNVGTWLLVEVARSTGAVHELTGHKIAFRQRVRDDEEMARLHQHHLVHIPDTEQERSLLRELAAPQTI